MSALLEKGFAVSSTSRSEVEKRDRGPLLVLGRFASEPAQTQARETGVRFQNIADLNAIAIADLVESARAETASARHGEWKPWFPVIDYDRCTNCMQCLSFCLFGVYGVDGDKRIQVQNN
ncbi:MAG TPA: ferredoxin family protein, partial [Chthoniobacteraceae bacterium]|nr:ferredoxin family protein [Chthoniobacteraceae bacterium]